MLWKAILAFAFLAALVPHEPDIGMGRAPAFAPAEIERARLVFVAALDRVRTDLKQNGSTRP